jgi:Papain fold toxin 2
MSATPPNQPIWDEISQLVSTFSLLECDKCAIAVIHYLNDRNIPYKILKLKTKRRTDLYIISDRVASNESITENGTHYGIEIFDQVFDNLSSSGLPLEEWLKDFHCRSGQFILEELDSM